MRIITKQEFKDHNNNNNTGKWIIANNYVYDVSNYINKHPGGSYAIKSCIGKDCSRCYNNHTKHGKDIWKSKCIGKISKDNNLCIIF